MIYGDDIMKKKMECSKKLAWFSGICFAIDILYSIFTEKSNYFIKNKKKRGT